MLSPSCSLLYNTYTVTVRACLQAVSFAGLVGNLSHELTILAPHTGLYSYPHGSMARHAMQRKPPRVYIFHARGNAGGRWGWRDPVITFISPLCSFQCDITYDEHAVDLAMSMTPIRLSVPPLSSVRWFRRRTLMVVPFIVLTTCPSCS